MIHPPYRIAIIGLSFTVPHYYYRDEEIRDAYNRPATRPLFSPNAHEAHRFFQEAAVVRVRDEFANMFPRYRVWAETIAGYGPLFGGNQPTISTEEREPLYVEPDGYEGSGLVFMVRPATTTHGPEWCIRSRDIPSLAEVHTSLESVYSDDPIECVRQMQQRWAQFHPQPFRPPELEARDSAELRKLVDQIHNQNHSNSRVRPGSVVDRGER